MPKSDPLYRGRTDTLTSPGGTHGAPGTHGIQEALDEEHRIRQADTDYPRSAERYESHENRLVHGAPSMKPAEEVDGEIVLPPGTRAQLQIDAEHEDVSGEQFAAEQREQHPWPSGSARIVYVAISPDMLVQLAREGATSEPLTIVALVPYGGDARDDTFELVLRQPHRKELWAALGEAPRR